MDWKAAVPCPRYGFPVPVYVSVCVCVLCTKKDIALSVATAERSDEEMRLKLQHRDFGQG